MLQSFALKFVYVREVLEMFIGAGTPKTVIQSNYQE
jgi:hypothetical protein